MKRIKIILLFALTTLLCVSCSNYLDIKPYGRTIPKTAEEFSALLHEQLNTIDAGNDSYIIGMHHSGSHGMHNAVMTLKPVLPQAVDAL